MTNEDRPDGSASDAAAIDAAILATIAQRPNRQWKAETVIDRAGVSLVVGIASLARLSRAGQVERIAPGRYRRIAATGNVTSCGE